MAQEENKKPVDPMDLIKVGCVEVMLDIPVPENMSWDDTDIGKIVNDIPGDKKKITIDIKEGAQLVLHYSKEDIETPAAIELKYPELGIIGYLDKENIEQVKAFFNSIP